MAFKRVGIWLNDGSKRFCTRVQNLGNFLDPHEDRDPEKTQFKFSKNPPPRSLRRTFL